MRTLIHNATVITVDQSYLVLFPSSILIDESTIKAVGLDDELIHQRGDTDTVLPLSSTNSLDHIATVRFSLMLCLRLKRKRASVALSRF